MKCLLLSKKGVLWWRALSVVWEVMYTLTSPQHGPAMTLPSLTVNTLVWLHFIDSYIVLSVLQHRSFLLLCSHSQLLCFMCVTVIQWLSFVNVVVMQRCEDMTRQLMEKLDHSKALAEENINLTALCSAVHPSNIHNSISTCILVDKMCWNIYIACYI